MTPKRILTGLKPSGESLHIANYFAAVKPILDFQNDPERECFLFIANYHTLNQLQNPAALQENTLEIFINLLAFGIDPERTHLFIQSDIPELTELTWILNSITPMGLLQRAHAYKDAINNGKEANVGLFDYPVLMAADILMYDSNLVPVGKDQKQHVEIARDLAEKFNNLFGDTFVLPEPMIGEETMVVPGTDGQKMSKSYGNTINVFAQEKELSKKIMSIVTDSKGVDEPKTPETCTVFKLLSLLFSPADTARLAERYQAGTIGYGEAKKLLLTTILDYFGPARARYTELKNHPEQVAQLRATGAKHPRFLAQEKLQTVLKRTGLK